MPAAIPNGIIKGAVHAYLACAAGVAFYNWDKSRTCCYRAPLLLRRAAAASPDRLTGC